jgi:hypothetical protein
MSYICRGVTVIKGPPFLEKLLIKFGGAMKCLFYIIGFPGVSNSRQQSLAKREKRTLG